MNGKVTQNSAYELVTCRFWETGVVAPAVPDKLMVVGLTDAETLPRTVSDTGIVVVWRGVVITICPA